MLLHDHLVGQVCQPHPLEVQESALQTTDLLAWAWLPHIEVDFAIIAVETYSVANHSNWDRKPNAFGQRHLTERLEMVAE